MTTTEPTATAGWHAEPRPLQALEDLFERLHAAEIPYCQWKSNEHLAAALQGRTDLDLLVGRGAAQRLAHVLSEAGFKRFVVRSALAYPGIEDYLGFDPCTGTLIHLHIHYELTMGEKFLKSYRIPWEDRVLATRTVDDTGTVYVADPCIELLLLAVRLALKLRLRDLALAILGYRYVRGGQRREWAWLAKRVHRGRLADYAVELLGQTGAQLMLRMLASDPPPILQLLTFRQRIRPRLAAYRRHGPLGALLRCWGREAVWAWRQFESRLLGLGNGSTRTSPRGGLAIAVVGQDRQSTAALVFDLAHWLAGELAVFPLSDGTGLHAGRARRARGRGFVVIYGTRADGESADLILRLNHSPEAGAESPAAPASSRGVDLDTEQTPERLLLRAKQVVWDSL